MADKKTTRVDDIDAPIAVRGAPTTSRVGVSSKGLGIAAVVGIALVVIVGFGIMNAGPGDNPGAMESAGASDMPGQNQSINIAKITAEAEARRNAEQAQSLPQPLSGGGLQVRGQDATQPGGALPSGGSSGGVQSPRDQHNAWLEEKKYERIQGRILAADAAATSDLTKGGGAASGGGIRPVANMEGAGADPLARLSGARGAAHANVAGQIPAMLAANSGQSSAVQSGVLAAGGNSNVAAQIRNREFLREAADAGYLPEVVRPRIGQHELAAGSIIPSVMLTGINSDLPGIITAQVRQSIYDTFDESTLIVPQGARIIGRYSSQIAYGQSRVLVAWDELIMPNGNRINLRGMSGADGIGQAGFNDQVDNHFFRIWGSALMISILGVGVQLSQPQNSSVNNSPSASQQATGAAASSLNQAGSKVLERNIDISPTLSIRPGYMFNVIVNKSIVMPAYKD